jgi:hypothetical protein
MLLLLMPYLMQSGGNMSVLNPPRTNPSLGSRLLLLLLLLLVLLLVLPLLVMHLI